MEPNTVFLVCMIGYYTAIILLSTWTCWVLVKQFKNQF